MTDNDGFTDDGNTEAELTPDYDAAEPLDPERHAQCLVAVQSKIVDIVLNANASDACRVGTCRIVSVTGNDPGRTVDEGPGADSAAARASLIQFWRSALHLDQRRGIGLPHGTLMLRES